MAALKVKIPPMCQPVSVATVKQHCRVTIGDDDALIAIYVGAATLSCETFTRRKFINQTLAQFLDSFPYFTDSMMSQMAYPPSYYSLPRYSTTLWNYSQMIKLFYSKCSPGPVTITYVESGGNQSRVTMTGTNDVANQSPSGDFLVDINSEPARLFPLAAGQGATAGSYWPAVLYVPNAVEIDYVCGYNDDAEIAAALTAQGLTMGDAGAAAAESILRQADVPETIQAAVMLYAANLYENRAAVSDLTMKELPLNFQYLLENERVLDMQPTRG